MGVSKYTPELDAYICEKISKGVTLSDICRENGLPDRMTVYNWMKEKEDFALRFARARESGFDAIADDCMKIADDHTRDVVEVEITPGIKTKSVDYDTIHRSKLRVWTRLQLLAKWCPKRYGEKLDVTSDGEKIQSIGVEIIPPKKDDE